MAQSVVFTFELTSKPETQKLRGRTLKGGNVSASSFIIHPVPQFHCIQMTRKVSYQFYFLNFDLIQSI